MRRQTQTKDDDEFDERGVLKDGRSHRVRMTMADGATIDGRYYGPPKRRVLFDSNQPGPVRIKDQTIQDARTQAYDAAAADAATAWMPPHLRGTPSSVTPLPARPFEPPSILNDDRFIENDRALTTDAYAAYDEEQTNAWRTGAFPFAAGQVGDACTVRNAAGGDVGFEGDAGTLQLRDDRLVCVANNSNADAATIRDARAAAYADYDCYMEGAWRSK